MTKENIRSFDQQAIENFVIENGGKKFVAKQINEWLWKKSALSFDEMTNISKTLRDALNEAFDFNPIALVKTVISQDGTRKCAFKTYDGHYIEGVIIPTETRVTACISTQVGCSLDCSFCATGKLKLRRNLDASEIYDQVVLLNKLALESYGKKLTNIVYMGMGEPLLNYKNTLRSVQYITSEIGLDMSAKRITVSTAGIAKMIRKLADDDVKFNLALSLHAPTDQQRSEIMSINDSNSIIELKNALQYFYQKTRNKITYEYVILNEVNDSLTDAKNIVKLAHDYPVKVNIIEYNSTDSEKFNKSAHERKAAFVQYLKNNNIVVNVRNSRGEDIDAACGQLANKYADETA